MPPNCARLPGTKNFSSRHPNVFDFEPNTTGKQKTRLNFFRRVESDQLEDPLEKEPETKTYYSRPLEQLIPSISLVKAVGRICIQVSQDRLKQCTCRIRICV